LSLRRLGSHDLRGELDTFTFSWEPRNLSLVYLSWSAHRQSIALAVGLARFNQLSGITAISCYLGDIFAAAGFDARPGDTVACYRRLQSGRDLGASRCWID
jgi:hypothetical protein